MAITARLWQSLKCPKVKAMRGSKVLENLIGQKFGKLKVIGIMPYKLGRDRRLICLCDCGNQVERTSTWVRYKKGVSCGCTVQPKMDIQPGYTFNHLTVLGRANVFNGKLGPLWDVLDLWDVRCNPCGRKIMVRRQVIVNGIQKSCGCMNPNKAK